MALLGLVVLFVSSGLHAGNAHPGDSQLAFAAYAASNSWEAVHLAQFLGTALILGSMAALHHHLSHTSQPWGVSLLAQLGLVGLVATVAVLAVLQAVDGIALKFVVDRWAAAPVAEKAEAFRLAEVVRWVEVGVNSYFRVVLCLTLVLYGAAIMLGVGLLRWSRWFALASILMGAAHLAKAVSVAYNGFSSNPVVTDILTGPVFLLWILALGIFLWRLSARSAAAR
jgi:hypothetical protein